MGKLSEELRESAKATFYNPLKSELNRAADHIDKLEAALKVYADEDHWFDDKFEPIMFPEGECKCCYEHFSDQGEIARKALEENK